MRKENESKILMKLKKTDYIILILVFMIIILTGTKIATGATNSAALSISGRADKGVQVLDGYSMDLEFTAPTDGLTGFSFQFEGKREAFGDAAFLITAAVQNNLSESKILFQEEMRLFEQAYNYQQECYTVIVPFSENDIKKDNHITVTIIGIGMSKADNVLVKLSGKSGLSEATFKINGIQQKDILAGTLYYSAREYVIFPAVIYGSIGILLVLLIRELFNSPRIKRQKRIQKQSLTKRKIGGLLIILILVTIMLEYTYDAAIKTKINDLYPLETIDLSQSKENQSRHLSNGESFSITKLSEEGDFGGVAICLQETYDENGVITVEVRNKDSQAIIASAQRAIFELPKYADGILKLNFDSEIEDSKGKEYQISVYYSGIGTIEFLTENGGENSPKVIPLFHKNDYLKVLFLVFAILIIGFTLTIFLCEYYEMKLETIFFVSVVFLGILFELVIVPFAVPDEASHIDTAYRISNHMLGVEDTGIRDAIYKRECDIYTDSGIKRTLTLDSYQWLYNDWFKTTGNNSERLIFAADNTATTNALYFLPTAGAITIGRILGMGFLPMIYMARTANLLFSAWLLYLSIKKLPFGKSILGAIMLLPVAIQELASCSYDSLIIAITALYVSYCVYGIYSEMQLTRKDIFIIIITMIMIGICKGGVYAPLYLLSVWLVVKKGYTRWKHKKELRIVASVGICFIILLGIFGIIYIFMQPAITPHLNNGYYTPVYLIQHPFETIRLFEKSFYRDTHHYIGQLIGGKLGSLQISAEFLVPVGYLLLLGLTVIADGESPYRIRPTQRVILLATAVITCVAIAVAFLLSYPTFKTKTIGGMQGRYFIPALWLLLISFRSSNIIYKKKQYLTMIKAGYILGIGTVLQVVINTLTR